MPPAVVAVAGAALAGSAAFSGGIVLFGTTIMAAGWGAALVAGLGVLALGFASQLLAPKPKRPELPNFTQAAQDRTLAIRAAIGEWTIAYGIVRLGGFQTFLHVTGTSKEYLNMVVTHVGHRVRAVRALLLDDEVVPLDGSGNATGKYAGFVTAHFGLGTTGGDSGFMSAMIAACPDKWTSAHRQTGRFKSGLKFKYDRDKFPGQLPNPSVIAETYDTIADPRDSSTGFTDNWALCLAHYLQLPEAEGGIGAASDEIDQDDLIAAANSSDEMVARGTSRTFTADATADTVTTASAFNRAIGTTLVCTTTGSLPGGLAADTIYYWHHDPDNDDADVGRLCASLDDAQADPVVPIDLTSAGTGTHTLRQVVRFTIDAATDVLTLSNRSMALRLGTRLTLDNFGGALPTGFAAATEYFWIYVTPDSGQLATSLANARAGTAVTVSDAGSGTHLITADAEPRYTMNGSFKTTERPEDIINKMLTAGAGALTFVGGKWHIYAGVYRTASEQLDLSSLDGGITVQTRRSRRDLANGIKGTFSSPDELFQPIDYPSIQVAAYVTEDNAEEIWRDNPLEFTNSPSMAQRISRIMLERIRRQITTQWPCNLSAFGVQAMTTVGLTNALWGWSGKTFEALSVSFAIRGDTAPQLGLDIQFGEIDSSVFAWDETIDEAGTIAAPTTDLPDPFTVAPPTALACASGTTELYTRADGTIFSRIKVTWTAPADVFVTSDGHIEIRYKRVKLPDGTTVTEDWQYAPMAQGSAVSLFILDVQDLAYYDVEARSLNGLGVGSDARSAAVWSARVAAHHVIGKTELPTNAPSLAVAQNGITVILTAAAIADIDVGAAEFAFGPPGSTFEVMSTIEVTQARPNLAASCTSSNVPPGTWRFGVKYKDTSNNYSAAAAYTDLTITGSGATPILSSQADPGWVNLGAATGTGFIRHWTGKLVADGVNPLSSYAAWSDLPTFNPDPVAEAIYELPIVDLAFDDLVRVYPSALSYAALAGVTDAPAVAMQLDYYPAAGPDPASFADWISGSVTARYLRARLRHVPGTAPAAIDAFAVTVDRQINTQSITGLTIAAGGTTVTFPSPYHLTPLVTCIPQIGSMVGWVDNVTTTGAKLHIGPDTSHDDGGTGGYTASGI